MLSPLPPSRSRRIAKWTGLVACALILAAWAVSTRYSVYFDLSDCWVIGMSGGLAELKMYPVSFGFIRLDGQPATPWMMFETEFTTGLELPSFHLGIAKVIRLPFWIILLAAAIPTAVLWHRDRRTSTSGRCRICGYDLRASKDKCPECGTRPGVEPR